MNKYLSRVLEVLVCQKALLVNISKYHSCIRGVQCQKIICRSVHLKGPDSLGQIKGRCRGNDNVMTRDSDLNFVVPCLSINLSNNLGAVFQQYGEET